MSDDIKLPELPEPDSYIFQHEETGQVMIVDSQQVEWGFASNNPRLQQVGGMFTEHQMREYVLTDRQQRSTVEDERATFEACFRPLGFTFKSDGQGGYLSGYGAELWSGWQARAALSAQEGK